MHTTESGACLCCDCFVQFNPINSHARPPSDTRTLHNYTAIMLRGFEFVIQHFGVYCFWVALIFELWPLAKLPGPFRIGMDFSSAIHKMLGPKSLMGLAGAQLLVLLEATRCILAGNEPGPEMTAAVRVILGSIIIASLRTMLIKTTTIGEQAARMNFFLIHEPLSRDT